MADITGEGQLPSGIKVADFARQTLDKATTTILEYAKAAVTPIAMGMVSERVSLDTTAPDAPITGPRIRVIAARAALGGSDGGGIETNRAGTDYGPFELGSGTINYGCNTSANILVDFRLPTGSVRDGDALVYLQPSSNGWCKFIQWYNPYDPTDGRFFLHIGADFWHGGGNCVWVVNGYYKVIDPTPR